MKGHWSGTTTTTFYREQLDRRGELPRRLANVGMTMGHDVIEWLPAAEHHFHGL